VLCYRLAKANSSTQPFVLERLGVNEFAGSGFNRPCGDDTKGEIGETDSQGQKACKQPEVVRTHHWNACSILKDPILMNQVLVVGVEISDLGERGVNVDQIKALNVNVTNSQGAALNPSPIRPSFPVTASGGGGGQAAGSPGEMEDTAGKGNWWTPAGTHAPAGADPRPWQPSTDYRDGEVVSDANGSHFFIAHADQHTKGTAAEKGNKTKEHVLRSGKRPVDPFPAQPRTERILDGEVIWQEMNDPYAMLRSNAKSDSDVKIKSFPWRENVMHAKGDVVCVARGANFDNIFDQAFQIATQQDSAALRGDLSLRVHGPQEAVPATPPSSITEAAALVSSSCEGQMQGFIRQAGELEQLATSLDTEALHLTNKTGLPRNSFNRLRNSFNKRSCSEDLERRNCQKNRMPQPNKH